MPLPALGLLGLLRVALEAAAAFFGYKAKTAERDAAREDAEEEARRVGAAHARANELAEALAGIDAATARGDHDEARRLMGLVEALQRARDRSVHGFVLASVLLAGLAAGACAIVNRPRDRANAVALSAVLAESEVVWFGTCDGDTIAWADARGRTVVLDATEANRATVCGRVSLARGSYLSLFRDAEAHRAEGR